MHDWFTTPEIEAASVPYVNIIIVGNSQISEWDRNQTLLSSSFPWKVDKIHSVNGIYSLATQKERERERERERDRGDRDFNKVYEWKYVLPWKFHII